MKRFLLSLAAVASAMSANAQKDIQKDDSVKMYRLQEVEVTATRAAKSMPVVYSDLSKEKIAENSYGYDIPSVLALTPSMIATNETGIGIGGTSMRLRGTSAERLNVTINGVSMNNPDSHAMYWYDTPDLLSAVGTIQVQRGAGISTNGTGAFGGAINMTTDALHTDFGGDASLSYGSYNTQKQSVHIASGLLGGHWTLDARLSHIASDGYVDRGNTDLKSYMFQAGYYKGNTMLKLVSFGGKAKTYLTYGGVTKADMEMFGRRYHNGGMYESETGPYWGGDDYGGKMRVNYYDDHTDNYLQINNQLLFSQRLNDKWTLNATAFYTYGYGFYKQYKDSKKISEYLNLPADVVYTPEGDKVKADLIREKIMRNHMGGINAAAHYTSEKLALSFGGSYSYYTSPHWGVLDWVDGVDPKYYEDSRWYDNDVEKHDANLFARANWNVAKGLRLFADLQYRHVGYKAWGTNDNNIEKTPKPGKEGVGKMQPIDVDVTYDFFNPHIGLNYELNKHHNFYFSFSIAQKEPTRGDFTDRYMFEMFTDKTTYPESEKMFDYELGYTYTSKRFMAGINLYYMKYDNQLVPTGRINDGYDSLNDNVKDSYRRGIELSLAWKAANWLTASANATFSQNCIENYENRILNQDADWNPSGYIIEQMGTTRLAFSPKTIANLNLDFHYRGWGAIFNMKYVSKQYFTNYVNSNMQLDAYYVSNLNLSYTLRTKSARSVRFGILIDNLFNTVYESNGYGWTDAVEGKVTYHALYFPQAPTNVLANVTVKF